MSKLGLVILTMTCDYDNDNFNRTWNFSILGETVMVIVNGQVIVSFANKKPRHRVSGFK